MKQFLGQSGRILAVLFALCFVTNVYAQRLQPRVVTCDTTVAPQSKLKVYDKSSPEGALIEDPILITLENGMRAVQFSVTNAKNPNPFNIILKFRYTVNWTDDCGRYIKSGTNISGGAALDPQRQEIIQSTAPNINATHAILRTYVDNK